MALVTILSEFKNGKDIHFRVGQTVETDDHGAKFAVFISEGLISIPFVSTHDQVFLNFKVQQRRGLGQFVDMMNIAGLLPSGGGGPGSDTTAIHVDEDNEISGITLKASPVNADILVIEDSADSFNKRRVTVGSVMGGGGNLQDAYDAGQSIDMAAATGTLVFNATDGVAFEVRKAGASVIAMSVAGAVAITPTSGQNITLTSSGVGEVILDSSSNDIRLRTSGVDRFFSSSAGLTNIQGGTDQVMFLQTTGTGDLTVRTASTGNLFILAAGTGDIDINAVGGDVALQQNGANRILAASVGSVSLLPETDQGVFAQVFGTGVIELNTQGTGDITLDATGGSVNLQSGGTNRILMNVAGDIALTAGGGDDITIAPGDGEPGQRVGGNWITSTGTGLSENNNANIRGGDWTHTGGEGASPNSNFQPGIGGGVSIITGKGGDRLTTALGEPSGDMSLGVGLGGDSGTSGNSNGTESGNLTLFIDQGGQPSTTNESQGRSGNMILETRAGGTLGARSGNIDFFTRDGGLHAGNETGGNTGTIKGTVGRGGDGFLGGGTAGDLGWIGGRGGDATGAIGASGGSGSDLFLTAGRGGDGLGTDDGGGLGGNVVTGSGGGGDSNVVNGAGRDGGDYTITVGVGGTGFTAGNDGSLIINVSGTPLTWPVADGTVGQFMQTDGAGNLSFATAAGGVSNLQGAYDGGNTIVTTAGNSIAFSNAVDATSLLTLDTTFAGTGRALDITMGVATTGGRAISIDMLAASAANGIHVEANATATGDPFRIVQSGANRMLVDGSGAIAITGGSNQNVSLASSGTGEVLINSIANAVRLQQAGSNRIVISAVGAVDVTPPSGQNFTSNVTGAGATRFQRNGANRISIDSSGGIDLQTGAGQNLTLDAATTGTITISSATGSVALQLGAVDHVLVSTTGAVAITPTSGQNFSVTTAGGGAAVINTYTFPDLLVDTFRFPDTDGTTGQVLTTDGNGILTFTSAAGGNNLQQAYAAGNSIEVTTANGTVSMANIADGADVLTVARTFAGAGEGIAVDMATGTTGIGLHVTSDVGSTGAALRIDQNGSGAAIDVQGTGISRIQLGALGAVFLDSAADQDVTIDSNGTGVLRLRASGSGNARLETIGAGNVVLNSASGQITLSQAAADRIEVTTPGAINVTPASGQDVTIAATGVGGGIALSTAASGGQITLDANGGSNVNINSATGGVSLEHAGAVIINVPATGAALITPANNQNFDVTTAGSGNIILDALAGTGSIILSASGTVGIDSAGQMDLQSTVAMNLTSGAAMSLRPAGNLNLEPSAAGVINIGGGFATLVDIRPFAAGADINIRAQGAGGTTTLRADSGLVSIVSNANEIEFIDTGGSIITLSQGGDRALTDTAAGEVLDSATSIIAAFNRLAESTKLIQDFQPAEISTSEATPITRCTIVIPANTSGVDENYIIEGSCLIRSSSATNESTVDVFNLTGGAALGFAYRIEMDDPANQNDSCYLRFSVIQANLAAAQTLELRFFNDGATTFITEAGLTAKRAYV